ncbi:hypothetical protein, partial [Limnohabitans sp.]|uniref:hypothetical protein n=1 Tax=Limnohabitans sp. TaxID=1907725 RepID=UPI00286EE296
WFLVRGSLVNISRRIPHGLLLGRFIHAGNTNKHPPYQQPALFWFEIFLSSVSSLFMHQWFE